MPIKPWAALSLWAFDGGGGDPFYQDALVMDFAAFGEVFRTIKDALARELPTAGVTVEEWPDATADS